MKKFLFAMILLAPLASLAQTEKSKMQFNVGVEAAYPIDVFNKTNNFGAGATIKAVVGWAKDIKWTFTTGFMSLKGKDVVISENPKVVKESPNVEFIPIKTGVRINVTKRTFFEPEAVIRLSTKGTTPSGFGFAAGFGYAFEVKKNPMDISFRYESTYRAGTPLTFVGGRIGIAFPQ